MPSELHSSCEKKNVTCAIRTHACKAQPLTNVAGDPVNHSGKVTLLHFVPRSFNPTLAPVLKGIQLTARLETLVNNVREQIRQSSRHSLSSSSFGSFLSNDSC
jgi:hypothetical protein